MQSTFGWFSPSRSRFFPFNWGIASTFFSLLVSHASLFDWHRLSMGYAVLCMVKSCLPIQRRFLFLIAGATIAIPTTIVGQVLINLALSCRPLHSMWLHLRLFLRRLLLLMMLTLCHYCMSCMRGMSIGLKLGCWLLGTFIAAMPLVALASIWLTVLKSTFPAFLPRRGACLADLALSILMRW